MQFTIMRGTLIEKKKGQPTRSLPFEVPVLLLWKRGQSPQTFQIFFFTFQ